VHPAIVAHVISPAVRDQLFLDLGLLHQLRLPLIWSSNRRLDGPRIHNLSSILRFGLLTSIDNAESVARACPTAAIGSSPFNEREEIESKSAKHCVGLLLTEDKKGKDQRNEP